MPGFVNAAMAPRWILLSISVPLLLLLIRVRMTPGHWVVLGILIYATSTLLWTESRLDGIDALWKAAILAGVFCLGASISNLNQILRAMAWGLLLMLPLVIAQKLGLVDMPQAAPPAGLFINKNILAELSAALLVSMLYQRRWILCIAPVICLMLIPSRAAFVGLSLALIMWVWPRLKISTFQKLALTMLCVVMLISGLAFETQRRGLPIENLVKNERLEIWQDTIQGFTPLGNGIGSFWTMAPKYATHFDQIHQRSEFAHNEYLHTIFEFGLGTLLFIPLLFFIFRGEGEGYKLVLVALFETALFAFPFHIPTTGFIVALLAGNLCASRAFVFRLSSHGRVEARSGLEDHSRASSHA